MDYIDFGQRVKVARLEKRLTQEALAERAGVSTPFIGHIERGTRKASMETLVSIANALGTDPNALLRASLRKPKAV